MLKAAIEKIVSLATPVMTEAEGRTFCVGTDGAKEVRPALDYAERITLNSLDSLIKMIKTEALNLHPVPLYITIPNHLTVDCFTQPNSDLRFLRQFLYQAKATDVPGWEASATMKFEEAMIAIRTRFQDTPDSVYALKLLSDISTGAKITFNDNGIATQVVTQKGISLQTNEPIRPIVTLKPYRTYQEVEQPASQFLIRVSDRGISFIEADGGMWRLTARNTIKAYLEENLAKEVEDGAVVIAL